MTADFKIQRNNKNEINSKDGLILEMDTASDYETPAVTTMLAELYTQTLTLFATINKGQLSGDKDFGMTTEYKMKMQGTGFDTQLYRSKLVDDLMSMASTLFIENNELLEFANKEMVVLDVGGNDG